MQLTPAQHKAVVARGNVLVTAAAGTGKTGTLVARCIHCLCEERPRAALDELLIVTFTEAAAAELRERLRARLEQKAEEEPRDSHWPEQIALFDSAHIGTLHSFCFKLVRQHFYELNLDPQSTILEEGEARLLANECLDDLLQEHYEEDTAESEAVRQLIQCYGGTKGDGSIRALVLQLHNYIQTRADPNAWLEAQIRLFEATEPAQWRVWLEDGVRRWRVEWENTLETLAQTNEKAAECLQVLRATGGGSSFAGCLEQLLAADEVWPHRRKGVLRKPLEAFFEGAAFFASLSRTDHTDPLLEDWNWTRGYIGSLLKLTREFMLRFSRAKRESAALDFHDLEQCALRLLWDFESNRPRRLAEHWRKKFRFVFVDEYQDINAAQDKIIQALSREGKDANRFLVGDVKQSIYGFRLANPAIFSRYEKHWTGAAGCTVSLVENFRSREGILNFVNDVFGMLMRPELSGLSYGPEARLQFGAASDRERLRAASGANPRAELLLCVKSTASDIENEAEAKESVEELLAAEKEARMLAQKLKQLRLADHQVWDPKRNDFRSAEWRDMAVLLRAPAAKADCYAKAFEYAGIPLSVERRGFYETAEVADVLNLLKLLDNPLQDIPLIAVLRSPLVGLSLDELASIRIGMPKSYFWTALGRWRETAARVASSADADCAGLSSKIEKFLARFATWRKLARHTSLSRCIEAILAETQYEDWVRGQARGAQRGANLRQLVATARRFDEFQRQGLFRFLRFVEAQQESGAEPEVPAIVEENAVRLMSIHQSKGLEFPVVAIGDLGKRFNLSDLNNDIIVDEDYGLCPRIKPPHVGRGYPSLPNWLARNRKKREAAAEELRLLYVAMTRARDTLILTASVSEKELHEKWSEQRAIDTAALLGVKSYLDWMRLWFVNRCPAGDPLESNGATDLLRWETRRIDETQRCGDDHARASSQTPTFQLSHELVSRLGWSYPFPSATAQTAKTSVSAVRKRAVAETDEESAVIAGEAPAWGSGFRIGQKARRGSEAAAARGSVHHKFMQFVRLNCAGSLAELRAEAQRMVRERILSTDDAAVLELESIAAFWDSEMGRLVRQQPVETIHRELEFTARFAPREIHAVVGTPNGSESDDFVVVQGVADLAVVLPHEIWLIDFKTDALKKRELGTKVQSYRPQLELYAMALGRIYGRPVSRCGLYFFSVNAFAAVPIQAPAGSSGS